jgi:transposase-like protein
MEKCFSLAQQQRCITHKVRGIEHHLNYSHLSSETPTGDPLNLKDTQKQRSSEIVSDACKIYQSPQVSDA